MEVVATVSLAAAVVQFVQFTSKVASKGSEYHKTAEGLIAEHSKLEHYTQNFMILGERLAHATLQVSSHNEPLSFEERSMVSVAANCRSICQEISDALKSHARTEKPFSSLRHALKAVWNANKIDSLLRSLHLAKDDLVVNLLVVIM